MYTGFVYKWTYIPTSHYYIGIHKGHIDDGYIGSGKKFQAKWKLTEAKDWVRDILFKCEYQDCIDFEGNSVTEETLKDTLCLNLQPGGGKYYEPYGFTHKDKSYRTKPQQVTINGTTYPTRMMAIKRLKVSFAELDELIEY